MALGIWLLAAFALVGGVSDRTIVHFSSTSCSACKRMEPVIDQLRSEGVAIRSIDAQNDRVAVQHWRVHQIPTLIVLENQVEVDRIVGVHPLADLRLRLTRNASPQVVASDWLGHDFSTSVVDRNPILGPNHPHSKALSSASKKGSQASLAGNQNSLMGENHPYYARHRQSKSESKEAVSARRGPSRSARAFINPLLKSVTRLPELPDSMNATVRIRVKYPGCESVGTGTIIDSNSEYAVVLTCGHLFRRNEERHPAVVEYFRDGEVVRVTAKVVDMGSEKVDLGLIAFRPPSRMVKVSIRPRSEPLHELEAVFSIGCDRGAPPSRRDSLVSKLNRYVGTSNVEIAGAPVQGRSGGGLFDASGRLVAVCFASDEELDEGLFVGPEAIYAKLEQYLQLQHLVKDSGAAQDPCAGKDICPLPQ